MKMNMTKLKGLPSDTAKGFRRTARRTPDRLRAVLVFLAWSVTAGVPALFLASAAGIAAATIVARTFRIYIEHDAAVASGFLIFVFSMILLSPLLKAAWGKLQEWDYEIKMTKTMED